MSNWESYESPLTQRYERNSPLLKVFSETAKIETWRQLWIWLAEAEKELGLPQISDEMIEELKANKSNIDKEFAMAEERRVKHDVMAHNHTYGKVCPKAAGIIHLGATSCYVQDNADLIRQRDALDYIIKRYAIVLDRLAEFAEGHIKTVTVGRTHWQTASLVTVGKRATLWLQELFMVFQKLINFRKTMRFRGIKGATGTQDSFLTLFNGDDEKVQKLDDIITAKAGFKSHFYITGQTYPRQQDADLLSIASFFGAASKKVCTDIRFLQSQDEIMEPFEKDQIGSSAMPYKQNPMKSERVCSLAKLLLTSEMNGLLTFSDQGLERTLDDSANRRICIPEALLTMDAILTILQNIFEGLHVHGNVARKVEAELPFLALEKALMKLSKHDVSRQEAHAKIKEVALNAKSRQEKGEKVKLEDILSDSYFDQVRDEVIELASDPINFTGSCARQVREFLDKEFNPVVEEFLKGATNERVQLDV